MLVSFSMIAKDVELYLNQSGVIAVCSALTARLNAHQFNSKNLAVLDKKILNKILYNLPFPQH